MRIGSRVDFRKAFVQKGKENLSEKVDTVT